jgi:ribosomal protein S18 acetylase RimI-like enzyme
MRYEVYHDDASLERLREPWTALVAVARPGLFLEHAWIATWWRAHRGLDELWVVTAWEGSELVGVWPLHLRAPRSGPIGLKELRLLGDLGGLQRSVLCRPEQAEQVAEMLARALAESPGWDHLEAPIRGRMGEVLPWALERRGLKTLCTEGAGRATIALPPRDEWPEFEARLRQVRSAPGLRFRVESHVPVALDALFGVCRKEWASQREPSPVADPQAVSFLAQVAPPLVAEGRAWIGLVELDGRVVAADLVVRSRDSFVQLLSGVDPEQRSLGSAVELALGSIGHAVRAGGARFAFFDEDVEQSPLGAALGARIQEGPRLRSWSSSTLARLHRGVSSLQEAVKPAQRLPAEQWDALRERLREQLRTRAPEVVQRAVARVASYATLHLYRGELFTRALRNPPELDIRLLSAAEFEALAEPDRVALLERLELVEPYCRQKWQRGDLAVLARVSGRPAGIVWCARASVYVPDIAREVRPQSGECYIHDVYVNPAERGRQVAPAMLDFLARELRARDVYRAWALIERSNVASVRAFEKAAYIAVADVLYARMGLASRLSVRPPDPEARQLLGLS